jgi:uncharacterized repeat protein (TIGR03803 family)
MNKLDWWMRTCGVFLLWATAAVTLPAQTFTTLDTFNYDTNGAEPTAALIQATNGDLYGTTSRGASEGTVFKITPKGVLTNLYTFSCPGGNCTNGQWPYAGLVQGTNGEFYGTTYFGGANDTCPGPNTCGTVFKITPSGTLKTLHSFDGTDGQFPYIGEGLIQATNGNFYGTTNQGGANSAGTVFKITPSGKLTTLYNFCSKGGPNCTDGAGPWGGLVQATNGDLYGTTAGTVFKITQSGRLTTLHTFAGTEGRGGTGLVQGTDGNFYGTTISGGTNVIGGTVFTITPSGTLTTLYSFCSQSNCTDGQLPYAGVVQGTDGNFYGTTQAGGANGSCVNGGENGCGTVFSITPSGTLTTLYNFCPQSGCTDGTNPFAGLVQDTNGAFYGTTWGGGLDGVGTVFSLSVGLAPFVETQPTSAKIGAAAKILGTSLTGATVVTFNGTTATFTVVSASEIITTVPAGATTGTVLVTTSSGTLSSNVPFTVN